MSRFGPGTAWRRSVCRLGGLIGVVLVALAVGALAAAAAQAAPELQPELSTPFGGFEIGGTGRYDVRIRNDGDAPTPGGAVAITATVELPEGVTADGWTQDGSSWDCTISPDQRSVTCSGSSMVIPPGKSQCRVIVFGSPVDVACGFAIQVSVDAGAAEGLVMAEAEVCGGGAAGCGSTVEGTELFVRRPFGSNFGIASINTPTTQAAPAFPGTSAFWAGTCDVSSAPFGPVPGGVGSRPEHVWAPTLSGGNATGQNHAVPAPATAEHCIDSGRLLPNHLRLWREAPSWRLAPVDQAGAHPDGTATMWFRRYAPDPQDPDGAVDNIYVDLPAGFVGDPTAVPKCTAEQFAVKPIQCPPSTQVGVIKLFLKGSTLGAGNYPLGNEEVLPVYNLEPRHGNVAELGFPWASSEDVVTVRIVAKARTNGDFGVTAFAAQIPAPLPLFAQSITLWGTPWAASNDLWRSPQGGFQAGSGSEGHYTPFGHLGVRGLLPEHQVHYDPSWGPIRPFLSNPTECTGSELSTRMLTDQYLHPGAFSDGFPDLSDADWKRYESPAPAVTGCAKNPFAPVASFAPTSTLPDSASGIDADISIPQNDDPPAGVAENPDDADGAPAHWRSDAGLATAHLDKTVVRLPEGMTVNPSGATGLEGCSDAQLGVRQVGNPYLFNNSEPSCPDGSRIGTVEATTPLLEGSPNLAGEVYLGSPKSTDPQSGEMFRLFLVLRNRERGLLAKVYGSSVADPNTGRLTATFDKNPRVPVENIKVRIKGGERGLLALPQGCGARSIDSTFTPWTAAHGGGGPVRSLSDPFTVAGNCAFGFTPSLDAGMSTRRAKAHGQFSFKFGRVDGEQWFSGLTATLPTGLLASVYSVPLCRSADAAAGTCPAGSRIGSVDAAAGSGSPFWLERKGDVYLTEGYKGGPYGLLVDVPVEAGPFRGAMALSPIRVRQAIYVDRETAQVRAVSDPFPEIHHGIPLRIRQVAVLVDRPAFMVNPTDCSAKQVKGEFVSTEDTHASAGAPFQVAGCRELALRPRLSMRLTGRKQVRDGKHPGLRAVLTQQPGEANLKRVMARLPLSLALDPERAQSDDLCEFEEGRKPDPNCPAGSVIGRARAFSPLLNRPLTGPVYFVKNVRLHPVTGNPIRTLPTLLVKLSGEIDLNVRATTEVQRGRLVSRFPAIPDAAVERFELNLSGGRDGILVVSGTNLCRRPKKHKTWVEIDGQNGRRHDFNLRMATPCPNKKPKR